jgi:hypothetical protein
MVTPELIGLIKQQLSQGQKVPDITDALLKKWMDK